MLRVVDIASHQAGINPAALDCDAVIVKATGGTTYTNGYPNEDNDNWREWADATLASGKKLGLYHYAMEYGAYNTAYAEARHFLDTISDYIGRAALFLDFEADAQKLPVSWAREWLDAVASETGSTPFFYAYAAYLNSRDHSEIAHYPLWMATYLNKYSGGGWVVNPDNTWPTSSWGGMTMYQYTSTGRIGGYDDDLDLSIFYGDGADWDALIGGSGGEIDRSRIEAMVNYAIAIAEDDSHGYSWADRWDVDRDCSSLMYDAADHAGYGVGRGPDKTRYTGTMEADFSAAGFSVLPYGGELVRGDILLNDHHTEMYIGDGMNVGAHIAETGDVYGEPGDQTGYEISIAPNPGGFDVILRPPVDRAYRKDDDTMQFIYQPDSKPYLVYHDGTKNIGLSDPDQVVSLRDNYRRCTGRDLPMFALGTPESPWAARFEQIFPYMEASDVWGGHAR